MATGPVPTRIVPRRAAERIRRIGLRPRWHRDLYHRALMLRWYSFMALGAVVYLAVNLVFALLYLAQPGSIMGGSGSFADAFFFSVQTIATIGYGQMSPGTLYANLLVTVETMAGLMFLALATGVTFARISRPTARVMFAEVVVVGPQNGVPTLSIRLANERASQILEASVAVAVLRDETTLEGDRFRRFHSLKLGRSHTPVFALSFTLRHAIDADSPLYGATAESLAQEGIEILITVTGLEEVSSQTVHARYSYGPADILFGHRYKDVFSRNEDGRVSIDYSRFNETEAVRGA